MHHDYVHVEIKGANQLFKFIINILEEYLQGYN